MEMGTDLVIVHADDLRDMAKMMGPTEEGYEELTRAEILQARIRNRANEVAEQGGRVHFLGKEPEYLLPVRGVEYFGDTEEPFGDFADYLHAQGLTNGVVCGVDLEGCVAAVVDECAKRGVEVSVDRRLTDDVHSELKELTVEELKGVLVEELTHFDSR